MTKSYKIVKFQGRKSITMNSFFSLKGNFMSLSPSILSTTKPNLGLLHSDVSTNNSSNVGHTLLTKMSTGIGIEEEQVDNISYFRSKTIDGAFFNYALINDLPSEQTVHELFKRFKGKEFTYMLRSTSEHASEFDRKMSELYKERTPLKLPWGPTMTCQVDVQYFKEYKSRTPIVALNKLEEIKNWSIDLGKGFGFGKADAIAYAELLSQKNNLDDEYKTLMLGIPCSHQKGEWATTGFAIYKPGHDMWMYNITTKPEHRRKGYAQDMAIELMKQVFNNLGVPSLKVILVSSVAGVKVYESVGFVHEGDGYQYHMFQQNSFN